MDLLVFKDVQCALGGKASILASGIVAAGSLLHVKGPSGAGKSTLLRTLARLRQRTAGDIALNGIADTQITPAVWRRKVHYCCQRPVAFPGTVTENLHLPYTLGVMRSETPPTTTSITEVFSALGLSSELLLQQAKTLSGGELARVALARAILSKPTVLMLDEPTSALDADTRRGVLNTLQSWLQTTDGAIVLVTHLEEDLATFDQVTALEVKRTNGR